MTEDPLLLPDQSQIWKTHVTVSLWSMKWGRGIWTVKKRWAEDGECIRHSLFVCIKLYRTGQHTLFHCERLGCKIGQNKPSMKECEPQMFTGEGRVYSPDTMYNLGLI